MRYLLLIFFSMIILNGCFNETKLTENEKKTREIEVSKKIYINASYKFTEVYSDKNSLKRVKWSYYVNGVNRDSNKIIINLTLRLFDKDNFLITKHSTECISNQGQTLISNNEIFNCYGLSNLSYADFKRVKNASFTDYVRIY